MASYTVKRGDTLWAIARQFGLSSWQPIYEANRGIIGGNPDLIQPGMTFEIPGVDDEADGGDEGDGGDGGGGDANNPDPETTMSVLQGSEMQWYKDGDTWYLEYGLPGSDRTMFFEATPDQMDALFGEGVRPDQFNNATFKNLSRREGVVFGGNISEVEGDGNWDKEVQKTIDLALDEGKLPTWMGETGEALDILYIAQAEGKNKQWIIDQMAQLPEFKTRFKGLDTYVAQNNLTYEEGVADFLGYENHLKNLEKQFGGNPESIVPAQVGDLLNKGYTTDQLSEVYGRFEHMRKNADALNAFNAVLQANDMEGLTLQGAYEFMAGNAPQDLYDIWEAASITEMATAGGFAEYLDPSVALDYAYSTPGMLDAAQINQQSQAAAADLLRFRHELDLGKFGLDHEDIVDAAFGMKPRSGATIAEVQEKVQRAQAQAQASLQGRPFSPFRDFNQPGQPAESLNTGPTR